MSNEAEYSECKNLLREANYSEAERRLWAVLEKTPRAAQVAYLLGVTLLLQRKFTKARLVIEKSYRLKPWIRDDLSDIPAGADAITEAKQALPDWLWTDYQCKRNRWRSVGLNLDAAVQHQIESKSSETPFYFLQVGANDGITSDPITKIVRRFQLPGLLVEPMPVTFEKLKSNYENCKGLTFANVAVSETDGPISIFFEEGDRTTLASVVPDRNALRSNSRTTSIEVRGLTIDSLLGEHDITHVTLLQIDTEGFDYKVLKQARLKELGTNIVNMEFYCLSVEERLRAFDMFSSEGFAYYFDGMDLLAVRRDIFADEFCIFESDIAVA
jgi:FkbM family methyltransferase